MFDPKQELMATFGQRLKRAIGTELGVQKQLATLVGVSEATFSIWIHGKGLPKIEDLVRLADLTGLHVDYLLGREPEDVEPKEPLRVVETGQEALRDIITFVDRFDPSEMYLIQYSSDYASDVMKLFRNKPEKKIYLLIKYPGSEDADGLNPSLDRIAPFQSGKIRKQLTLLFNQRNPMLGSTALEVRCYPYPGAMRAVYVGTPIGERLPSLYRDAPATEGLLSLSLYRYVNDNLGVIGEENPHMQVRSNTEDGKLLYTLFENTFMEAWETGVPAEEVLRAMGK